jgi:hypothetical protein
MLKNIQKFNQLTPAEKKLFFEAYLLILRIKILLKLTSLSYLVNALKRDSEDTHINSLNDLSFQQALLVGRAVKQAAGHHIGEVSCLVQSLVTQRMLQRRSIIGTLYIGVNKSDEGVKAHAWLKCNDRVIVGEHLHELYKVMLTFGWMKH